jgi:uncharacterized protein YfaP (DUF2135 family)
LVVVSQDGRRIFTVNVSGGLEVWETSSGRRLARADWSDGRRALCAAFDVSGNQLAVASRSAQGQSQLQLFEVRMAAGEGEGVLHCILQLEKDLPDIALAVFHPDGN